MDLILISVSYLLLKNICPPPRGAVLSWSWWMPKAPQDPQGTPGLLTHLSVSLRRQCSLTKLCSVSANPSKKTWPTHKQIILPPSGTRNAWWAACYGLSEIKAICLYLGTHEKVHLRTLNKRFGINVLLTSSPTWIILWSYLWWMAPWINTSLAQTEENCPKPGSERVSAPGLAQYPAPRPCWWSFAFQDYQWLVDHSLLEDSVLFLRGTCAHSHWDIKDLVLASRNSATCLAHQVEPELLYHSILQNYLCGSMSNCSVIGTKSMAVAWPWGALSHQWGREISSPWFGSPQSLLLLFLSVLTSHSMSRHKTDIAGHATSGFQQILYLE